MKPDLTVLGSGSVYLLVGDSRRGRRWLDRNIAAGALEYAGDIAVEHRYLADIVTDARDDGLRVAA
jgi:hypothetical protein